MFGVTAYDSPRAQRLARARIRRDHRAALAGGEVEDQVLARLLVNLIERRVAQTAVASFTTAPMRLSRFRLIHTRVRIMQRMRA
jgi:hypothetical protein